MQWWDVLFEIRNAIGQIRDIQLDRQKNRLENDFVMRMKVFGKLRFKGEGHGAAHWITNGSDNGAAGLSPFVKGRAGIWKLSLCVALAFGVTACSTIGTRTTPYAAVPELPPTTPNHVKILLQQPPGPYQELGTIVVDGSTEPMPPPEKFEEALRHQASDLGADAVVVLSDRVQPDGLVGDLPPSDYYLVGDYWTRSVQTISGRQSVAVAIKYGTLPMTGRTDYLVQ